MVQPKALAYELTKHISLDTLEAFREDDTPYDMENVAEILLAEELPKWLYYAIEESEHTITEPTLKIPLYLGEDTIKSLAKEYSMKTEDETTLTDSGTTIWTENEDIENYKEEFQRNYNAAQSSIEEVFAQVFSTTEAFDETDKNTISRLSADIISKLDIFGWELGRKRAKHKESDDTNGLVAEWVVESLSPIEVAESYLSYTTEPTEYTSYQNYRDEKEKLAEEWEKALSECDIRKFSGQIDGTGLLSKQTEFVEKLPDSTKQDGDSQIDKNLKEVIDEEFDEEEDN